MHGHKRQLEHTTQMRALGSGRLGSDCRERACWAPEGLGSEPPITVDNDRFFSGVFGDAVNVEIG